MASVLIVDDDASVLWVLSEIFEEEGHQVGTASSGADALAAISRDAWDLVLLDVRMPGMDGLEVLKRMRMDTDDRRISVVMMSDTGSVKTAIYALRLGAFDYIAKPINVDELKIVVRNALRTHDLEQRVSALEEQLRERTSFENLIGQSEPMQKIYGLLEKVAGRDVTVLILGESGTGKELIAQAIHQRSQRRDGPFVAVDCGTLPENLIESELFGYERGAFTGADKRKAGKFEQAHGGSLFFDEIGNISPNLQVKLLRALESGEVTRLGGSSPVRTDVRIVSATNADLEKGVGDGSFREDLFYRLNVITVKLPPLRDRRDDIPLLVDHFMETFRSRHGKPDVELSREALKAFYNYHWPGNVRELRNLIERGRDPGRRRHRSRDPAGRNHGDGVGARARRADGGPAHLAQGGQTPGAPEHGGGADPQGNQGDRRQQDQGCQAAGGLPQDALQPDQRVRPEGQASQVRAPDLSGTGRGTRSAITVRCRRLHRIPGRPPATRLWFGSCSTGPSSSRPPSGRRSCRRPASVRR